MTFRLLNRVRMSVLSAPGTGAIPLNLAAVGFQSLTGAGMNDGDTTPYVLEDGSPLGSVWEYGIGTYHSSGTFTRDTVTKSSLGGTSKITATSAMVFNATIRAEDFSPNETLEDLTDVTITSPAIGDSLTWNGTTWVNGSSIVKPTVVQAAGAVSTTGGATLTATFGATPTPGNLIVGLCAYGNGTVLGTPTAAAWAGSGAWDYVVTDDDAQSTALKSSLAFHVVRTGDTAAYATVTMVGNATEGMVGLWEISGVDLTRFGAQLRNAKEINIPSNPSTATQETLTAIGALVLYLYGGPNVTTSRVTGFASLDASVTSGSFKVELAHDTAQDNVFTTGTVVHGTGNIVTQMMTLAGYSE